MPDGNPSRDDRKLEKVKNNPGIYRRHAADCPRGKTCGCQYVVRWKSRGKGHKRYFRTLDEAREYKAKATISRDQQVQTRETVEGYYLDWIDAYRGRTSRGLEDATREQYKRSFKHHVLPYAIGKRRMRDVTSRDVSDWFADLEASGATPNTIRLAKAALSAMMATAKEQSHIAANPVIGCRHVPRRAVEKRKRRSLTVADVDAILNALAAKWRLFFELLAHSGMRVSELLGLTWANVHLGDDPHVRVVEQFCRGERRSSRRTTQSAVSRCQRAWRGP